MVISPENILLVGAILLFLSVLVGKTGAKFGVPALLLFLGVGTVSYTHLDVYKRQVHNLSLFHSPFSKKP